MMLAAWMFDQVPWNPWVFWPIVVLPAAGLLLLGVASLLEKTVYKDTYPNPCGVLYWAAFPAVATSLIWLGVMFIVNSQLEYRATEGEDAEAREACFEIMDAFAHEIGPIDAKAAVSGHADLMRELLELPESDHKTTGARQAMAERGCGPSELGGYLDDWEDYAERRELLDSFGGTAALVDAIESLPNPSG